MANKDRNPEPAFNMGDKVMLTTTHQRCEYMQAKDRHMAKFMPCFDGPYEVLQAFPESSAYHLHLPPSSKAHATFHISELCGHVKNDDNLFPEQTLTPPKPLMMILYCPSPWVLRSAVVLLFHVLAELWIDPNPFSSQISDPMRWEGHATVLSWYSDFTSTLDIAG